MLELRPYQHEAIAAVTGSLLDRPAVVLPTGMGKTVIFAELATRWATARERTMVLVHRDELVRQTVNKLPGVPTGVFKARQRDLDQPVIVGSVQTLGRRSTLDQIANGHFQRIIVDECHHATADTYRMVLDHFPCQSIGFTATMERADKSKLGDVWQDVVYEKDILYGIRHGYLADIEGLQVALADLDLSGVASKAGGDYADGSLAEAMMRANAGVKLAEAWHRYVPGKRTIAFYPNKASAHAFAADFVAAGIPTEVVTDATPPEERQLTYKRLRHGEIMCISNVGVLSEGFDEPSIEVVIPRLTASRVLYAQQVGRGTRPFPGKTRCVVLDPTGVSSRFSLRGISDLSTTPLDVKPGETLREAAERTDSEADPYGVDPVEKTRRKMFGVRQTGTVDLFGESKSVWLKTRGGKWFIPAGRYTVFLWPNDDESLYRIGQTGSNSSQVDSSCGWKLTPMPLELAMAHAEQLAKSLDGIATGGLFGSNASVSTRNAAWRKRKATPTDAQKLMLQQLRIDIPDTKAEASDLISIEFASRVIDGQVQRKTRKQLVRPR